MGNISGAWSGGSGRPGSGAIAPTTNGLGGTTFADRMGGFSPVSLNTSANASVSRSGVEVGGSFGLTGLLTAGLLVVGLFALDRYVLDVPGVGRGK